MNIQDFLKNNFRSFLFVGLLVILTMVSITSSILMTRAPSSTVTPSSAAEALPPGSEAEVQIAAALTTTPVLTTTPAIAGEPSPTLPVERHPCQLTIRIVEAAGTTPGLTPTVTPPPVGVGEPPGLTPTLTPLASPTATPSPSPAPTTATGPTGVGELPESGMEVITVYLVAVATLLLLTGSWLVLR